MLNPKTTRMVVHTSLNVSLLIIATMVLINEVHKPCDWFLIEGCLIIVARTLKCLIWALALVEEPSLKYIKSLVKIGIMK